MSKEEMQKDIVTIFSEGVKAHRKGDLPIIKNTNGKDCFILNIPEKVESKFKKNFQLDEDETIMMARDTSPWNTRKEGLVITDRRIVYIPGHIDLSCSKCIVELDSFYKVTYDAKSLLFWGTEKTFFPIPAHFFLKSKMKSYDVDRATKNLGKLLGKIAKRIGARKRTHPAAIA